MDYLMIENGFNTLCIDKNDNSITIEVIYNSGSECESAKIELNKENAKIVIDRLKLLTE